MSAGPHPVPRGYEYIRRLGAGGFGEVFLARHVAVGRLVAIKRILPHALSDDDNVARFRREARVLAATDSPCVVRVFDLSTEEGNLYLVMEYVPGTTLTALNAGGPLPAADGLRILADVAEALREMASHGLVHRDVKPGNVLVRPDGHAKLADFGLARAVADTSAFRTAGGTPSGTPAYFPPEISRGTHEPDARSDAYSFAVMTYETLTGRRPFEAPDALSMLMAHWEREPIPPQEALPGLPDEASAALLAGLNKEPGLRPLPHELVGRLAKVAPQRWPAVERPVTPAAGASRHDPTIVSPGFAPPPLSAGPAATTRRPRRPGTRRTAVRVGLPLLTVLMVTLAGLLWWRPWGTTEGLVVESVGVVVSPASGSCPEAEFTFTGTIITNGAAGTLAVAWERPDGVMTPAREVSASAGQDEVSTRLRFRYRGSRPASGTAVLHVGEGDDGTASSTVNYVCR